MLRCARIAEFVLNSTICRGYGRQFAVKPNIFGSLRPRSTLVGHDKTAAHGAEHSPVPWNRVICASDAVTEKDISESLCVYEEFISEDEERSLANEVEPYLKRLKYEHDHWDDVSVTSILSCAMQCNENSRLRREPLCAIQMTKTYCN